MGRKYLSIPFDESTAATHIIRAAARTTQVMRVVGWILSAADIQTITFNTQTQAPVATAIIGPMPMIAGLPHTAPVPANPEIAYGDTAPGNDLSLTLGAAEATGGVVLVEVQG